MIGAPPTPNLSNLSLTIIACLDDFLPVKRSTIIHKEVASSGPFSFVTVEDNASGKSACAPAELEARNMSAINVHVTEITRQLIDS